LNLALFDPMDDPGHGHVHGDRYSDLPAQLGHMTVDRCPMPLSAVRKAVKP
jgi:hypothetical protein